MNKNKLLNTSYCLNVIAVVLYIFALLSNAFQLETRNYQSESSYTVTFTKYSVFDILNEGGSVGLIAISLGVLTIALVVFGLFIGLKKQKLGQSFMASGILYSFVVLNNGWLELSNKKYSEDTSIVRPSSNGAFDNGMTITREFGYTLLLTSVLIVVVSSVLLILASDDDK